MKKTVHIKLKDNREEFLSPETCLDYLDKFSSDISFSEVSNFKNLNGFTEFSVDLDYEYESDIDLFVHYLKPSVFYEL